jgi:predicted membrane protein
MEHQSFNNHPDNETIHKWEQTHRRGRIFGGIFIILIGALFLGREMGAIFPSWIYSWKVLLIGVGLFMGLKHSFRNLAWLVPIFVGGTFLLQDFYPELHYSNYIWPLAIMAFGLILVFKPRRNFKNHYWRKRYEKRAWKEGGSVRSNEDMMELNTVFGSIQKAIISKDFKGGEINVVFGSAEINLSQADIQGTVVIEINNVFAGTKIILPTHWQLRSEINTVMGGVEDKRILYKDAVTDLNKTLVLKGDVVFGGIEIQSF